MNIFAIKKQLGLLVSLAAVLTGCIDYQGIHSPRDDGQSTAEFRNEAEFIPNAILVREDTSPKWQLGRYAFKRGADRLLVISRITSFAEKLSQRKIRKGIVPKRYDQILERVWVSLELGVETGKTLDLDQLQQKFRVGYDEGLIDGDMYVQPNRVIGKLTLVEEGPNEVTIDIRMRVEPIRLPAWEYSGLISVPVTPSGVRAKAVQIQKWAIRKPVKKTVENETHETQDQTPDDSEQAAPPKPTDGLMEEDPPAATQPTGLQKLDSDLKKTLTANKWIGDSGDGNGYECRFQFDLDGRFIYSTCRSGQPARMKWGTYKIERDHVVMSVAYYGDGSATSGRGREKSTKPTEAFKCTQAEGGFLFEMVHPEGFGFRDNEIKKIQVASTYFEDMRLVPPPSRK